MNRSLRLTAGTLVLALPLTAAAGCGVEKKKTIKQELASAQSNLSNSKAASFTLSFADAKGNFAKALSSGGDAPAALVNALVKGSVTYVADPAGDATFKSMSTGASATDLKTGLSKVNLSFLVKDDKADLAELRLVAGDLYAHVNLTEIGVLAKAGGVDDFDKMLDENIGQADPRFAQVLTDVRAGKWLKLPLTKYLGKLQDLAGSVAPQLTTPSAGKKLDLSGLGTRAFKAVKPYIKVTDANDSSKDRVLDVKVQVRPALTALLGVLKAEKDLPFASFLGDVDASQVDKHVAAGAATGQITLHQSHLTGLSVDLESIRLLSTDPGTDSFAGVKVLLSIDDSAAEVTAPSAVSTTDLGSILDDFINGIMGGDSMGG